MEQAKSAYDAKKFDESARLYRQILADYPESGNAAEAMFLLGSLYQNEVKDLPGAVELLSGIHEKFPDSPYASRGLFVSGFLCANSLGDIERARTLYEKYLSRYAEADANIAASVRMELRTLGMSPEEALEALQKDTAAQVVGSAK
jgi:TolA-binding protein